ncbi:MAG: penicillin-binding protein activator, partial [Gammaproteobacteria bacterium]|nr:penicillin-binding protein activator [Gammaproteobacteria bacterium]
VSHLASMEPLPVPVLALNTTETNLFVPDNFYQFGLSPEDEAQQVAERATLEGLGNAIVITPEGDWGERVYTRFSERFTELGGEILEQQAYSLESNDFSDQIRSLLNLDESWQRHRSLKILLNRDVKFEPRRRKDVDFVFMAAFPRQARLITPQLQFHHASDLPVYATSHIYSGKQNPGEDRDMNGVIFCDTPWTLSKQHTKGELQQSINQLWPNASTHYSRLHAIGIDAYNILPYLAWLKETQYERYTGVTGNLYLDQYNKIHRTLKWARFVNGRPSVIQHQLIPASLTDPGPSLKMIQ